MCRCFPSPDGYTKLSAMRRSTSNDSLASWVSFDGCSASSRHGAFIVHALVGFALLTRNNRICLSDGAAFIAGLFQALVGDLRPEFFATRTLSPCGCVSRRRLLSTALTKAPLTCAVC
jgi:hypothetical protein